MQHTFFEQGICTIRYLEKRCHCQKWTAKNVFSVCVQAHKSATIQNLVFFYLYLGIWACWKKPDLYIRIGTRFSLESKIIVSRSDLKKILNFSQKIEKNNYQNISLGKIKTTLEEESNDCSGIFPEWDIADIYIKGNYSNFWNLTPKINCNTLTVRRTFILSFGYCFQSH